MEGFLWKRGDRGLVKGNKRRWFALTADGHLRYYEDPSEAKMHGDIDVSRAVRVSRGNAAKQKGKVAAFAANVFEIEVPGRCYTLVPEQPGELADWVRALSAHVDLSSFRGDLRSIAAEGPAGAAKTPQPPRSPPGPASAAARPSRTSGPADSARHEEAEEHEPSPVVEGSGRAGGGFFSRLGGGGGADPGAARLRELEEGYARMQSEVVTLKQELAVIRPASDGSRKGRGGLGESLLGDGGDRKRGGGGGAGAGRGIVDLEDEDEDEDEPEVLPGCGCCGGRCTCKVFFLVLANIVVIATGLAVAAVGGFALAKQQEFSALLPQLAMIIILCVGIGFVLMGAMGSFAATRAGKASGKCLLLLYVVFMAVLTLAEFAGGVAIIVEAEGLKVPSQASAGQAQVDKFLRTAYASCCNTTAARRSSDACAWLPDAAKAGCPDEPASSFQAHVIDFLKQQVLPIGGAAAGLTLIHGAAAWFAVTLICPCCGRLCCCCCRRKKPGDTDQRGSRPRKGSSRRRRRSSAYDDDFSD